VASWVASTRLRVRSKDPVRTVGPYQLTHPIGRGGMGDVWRAVHADTGSVVALKLVSLPKWRALEGIRREIGALARIRHPNVIPIVASGEDGGSPWYAMELVDGSTLRAWIDTRHPTTQLPTSFATLQTEWTTETVEVERPPEPAAEAPIFAPRGRVPVRDVVRLVGALCGALAAVHGEGVVHCDLKPENVLLRPDGTPVVADFGLASLRGVAGREVFEFDGAITGTVAYMAPEQGIPGTVDARADLYALGCIAYEMASGTLPFFGTNTREILARKRTHAAPPLREVAPDVPAALAGLVDALLATEPSSRIGYAVDAALALHRAFPDEVPSPAPAKRSLYRARLLDRDGPLAVLIAAVDGPDDPGICLIGGEGGVGKTRVALELARHAGATGRIVLLGEHPPDRSMPLAGLRGPLRRIGEFARDLGPDEVERVLGSRAAGLARYEPSLGPSDVAAVASTGEQAVHRLFADVAATLLAFAARRPVLVVLDDLQWADELTLGFLRHVQASPVPNVRFVATWRIDEGAAVRELVASGPTVGVTVGKLDAAGVAALASSMLATPSVPDDLASLLTRRSGGNPFFVAEWLRLAYDEGWLARDDQGRVRLADIGPMRDAMPSSQLQIVQRRLAGLTAFTRAVVDAGAITGRDLSAELLAAMLDAPREAVSTALSELVERQIAVVGEDGPLRFAHDKLREVALDGLAPDRARELHRRAASSLGRVEGDLAAVVAEHWAAAGDADEASAWLVRAARFAASRFASDDAERLLRRAHALVPLPAEARIELAELLLWVGRSDECLRELEPLDGVALTPSLEARRDLVRLRCLRFLGRLDDARAAGVRAIASATAFGDDDALGRALSNAAVIDEELGRMDEAADLYDRALAHAMASGSDALIGLVMLNLGDFEEQLGHVERALELAVQARERCLAAGDLASLVIVLANLGSIELDQGHLAASLAWSREAEDTARRIGDLRSVGVALGQVSRIVRLEGDFPRGLAIAMDAQDCLARGGDPFELGRQQVRTGHAALAAGVDPTPWLEAARRSARELGGGAMSRLNRDVRMLEGAIAGEGRVIRGELADSMATGLRAWLDATRAASEARSEA
jgi:serine/threonine protein kinase/tetratricopeptide (TPR) repeat protein